MQPTKKTLDLARSFVAARPSISGRELSEFELALVSKLARDHGVEPADLVREVRAEADWESAS